jgi:hypothetical protein
VSNSLHDSFSNWKLFSDSCNLYSSLYYDTNGQGQEVFTWIAAQNTTSFSGDISPLITSLSSIANAPSGQTYLGYYAFGSETFYSVGNVTLSVPKLALEVNGK